MTSDHEQSFVPGDEDRDNGGTQRMNCSICLVETGCATRAAVAVCQRCGAGVCGAHLARPVRDTGRWPGWHTQVCPAVLPVLSVSHCSGSTTHVRAPRDASLASMAGQDGGGGEGSGDTEICPIQQRLSRRWNAFSTVSTKGSGAPVRKTRATVSPGPLPPGSILMPTVWLLLARLARIAQGHGRL